MNHELSTSIKIHLHPNVKKALMNPKKALEVRGWLKTNKDKALSWRGDDGETMMHWAFCSDWVLACELKEAGLSFKDKDRFNRVPMDWLNDRLWLSIVNDSTNSQLSLGAKERLRNHTIKQIQYLWPQGARPSFNKNMIHPGVVWIRAGAWELLDLLNQNKQIKLDDTKNFSGWKNWLPENGSALHAWILSPDMPQRMGFLKKWINNHLNIDIRDKTGKTPLWYAVDAWVYSEKWQENLKVVIKDLIDNGADPFADDEDGITPYNMLIKEYLYINKLDAEKNHLEKFKDRKISRYRKKCKKLLCILNPEYEEDL